MIPSLPIDFLDLNHYTNSCATMFRPFFTRVDFQEGLYMWGEGGEGFLEYMYSGAYCLLKRLGNVHVDWRRAAARLVYDGKV